MDRVIPIVAVALLFTVTGCGDKGPPNSPPSPRSSAVKEGPEAEPQSVDALTEDEVATRSLRWDAEGRVSDFLWLVVHAIPAGSSLPYVEELIGKPMQESRTLAGETKWDFFEANPEEEQYDSLTLLFDAEGFLVEFLAVPQKSEVLELRLGVPRTPPETPTDVREAFVAQVRPIVKQIASRPEEEYLSPLISQSLLLVRRQPCSRALRILEGIVPESERSTMILHGSMDVLRRDGECWTVEDLATGGFGMIGHLDESSGELLVLADPPEE